MAFVNLNWKAVMAVAFVVIFFVIFMRFNKGSRRNRFEDIAFGSEYFDIHKDDPLNQTLYKWKIKQLTIAASAQDEKNNPEFRAAIDHTMDQLKSLNEELPINNQFVFIRASLEHTFLKDPVNEDGMIGIHYKKPPVLSDENYGLFIVKTNDKGEITSADIYIDPETPKDALKHICLEETIQSFGLMEDTYNDKSSIFYQGWTTGPYLNADDRRIFLELYSSPSIRPGMTRREYLMMKKNKK